MSVVADSIFIEISTLPGSIPYSLNKVYSESGDNSFRMPAVLSGDKKEAIFLYILELSIFFCQKIDAQVRYDNQDNHYYFYILPSPLNL